uniref:Uncharacterized protein C1orf101 homolog n=1 Tax=Phascolarctos cinereus TaxID=38626 RepID=A0A6P5JY07_PHACI|nr:uncharacterized protein C1orf101 homolog [Phascolarctos cinereus]
MVWEKVLASGVLLLGYSSALWRYRTNTKNYAVFNTRTTIHLEYEGPDFIEWDVPRACSIKNKSAPNTEMFCFTEGVHNIKPIVRDKPPEAEERYLFVDRASDCFLWYFLSSHMENRDLQSIQIWVYDPENASPEELASNASNPSLNSKSLSMQFLSMGQEPMIVSIISHQVYPPEITKQEGIWETHVPLTKTNLFMQIKGNSVALQDCFIADYIFLLSYVSLTFSQNPEYVKMTLKDEQNILFDWPPCFPATIATVSHWETLFTKDAFNTSEKIRIPPNSLTEEERHDIQEVCIIEEGIVVLTKGSVYLRRKTDFIPLDKKFGIPPNVTGIKTRTYCWPGYTPREGLELSQIIVWTTNEVFLGYSRLKFYLLTTLGDLMKILNLKEELWRGFSIRLATYTSDPTGVALLLGTTTHNNYDSLYLVFYDEDSTEWRLQDFSLSLPSGKKLGALFMYSALPNFVIWDDKHVHYSYQNYSENGFLRTYLGSIDLTTATNSTIHQVFIDYYGNGVIKMYNNKMLYFKLEIKDVALLHDWANENDNTLVLMNPTGELFLANLNYGIAKSSEYPIMLELYSSIFKEQTICPYLLFESSIVVSNIYLDKRDELTFWAQVIYRENLGVYPIVEIYGRKLLKEKRDVSYEIALGICTKNLTVTFYQKVDYEGVKNYGELQEEHMGHVMIQLRPSQFARTCPLSSQAVHVFVGCSSQRYLELKGYKENLCQGKNATYVIEKKYLRGNPPEDKFINYNISKYGCPIKISMTKSFHPVLHLYEGGRFIEEVKANFIIWEINGRKDFGYTLSMSDAGCVNEAQSWKSMMAQNKDVPLEEVWGPHNYRHCFSFSTGKPGDLTQPYEIINLTNKNDIVWRNHHIGFYVFQAKIIDPNYSFCNLTITFAIETFGLIPKTDPLLVFIFTLPLIFIMLICLVVSYFQYLKFFRKFIYEPSLESKHKMK